MKSIYIHNRFLRQLVDKFHGYNHPGAIVFGQSQSAKTASIGTFIEEEITQGHSVSVFDPHDQLRQRLLDFTLTLPQNRRSDLNVIVPADGLHMAVTPLAWTVPSEIPAVVSETRLMIKQAFGDAILSETQPNIDYWMDLALEGAAILGCPVVLAPDFLDRAVPHHEELVAALASLDPTLFGKLSMLRQMPIHEYLNVVGPGLKRLETVLKKNPLTRDLLSNTESVDASHLIRPGAINLFSFKLTNAAAKKQVLRKEDRRFFACLYAKAIYRAIYARDEQDRTHDHTVWLDELSVFEAIFSDIEVGMREAAKFKLKVGGIIQDTTALDGQQESPLLRVFLNNAHFQFFFRTQGADNELLSKLPHKLTWHPRIVRHIQKRDEQILTEQRIAVLRSRHHDWAWADQDGMSEDRGEDISTNEHEDESQTQTDQKTQGKSRSHNTVRSSHELQDPKLLTLLNTGNGTASGEAEDESEQTGRSLAKGRTRGKGRSRGIKRGFGKNRAKTNQRSGGTAYAETILPVYKFREVIQSVELLSDGQHHLAFQQIFASLPTGHCVTVVSGLGVVHLVFPMPTDQASRYPQYIQAQNDAFLLELSSRSLYLDPASIDGQYGRLIQDTFEILGRLKKQRSALLENKPAQSNVNRKDLGDTEIGI